LLIGRAGGKGHPEIPVEDEGVSSRHAKIIFDDAGEPSLLELGSTNGTRVNETIATPGLAVALKSGDQIVLGRWTRMTIKAK
jgi:pSer/pThr/pTyr-binding forkhead associated (FHA) protein